MQDQELDARLTDLESKVAENERTISDLNDVVRRQADEIDRLKSELGAVARQMAGLSGTLEDLEIAAPGRPGSPG